MLFSKTKAREKARIMARALQEAQGARSVALCAAALADTRLRGVHRDLTEFVAIEVLAFNGTRTAF
jgi:predicted nucleic acid-binding protein